MGLPSITDFVFHGTGILLFKIPLLTLIFLYAVFVFIVISRIKSFNRLVTIAASHASSTLQILAYVQFFLAVSLFLLALVIV